MRILDPACGSGSFLIRAYEEMLNYYRSNKTQTRTSAEGQEKLDLKQEELKPHLTIQEKSEVLRNHIFGVDIDEQAVEVTKLSLMLKMLEGEYGIVPGRAILPMLDKNIKCGNSLISGGTLELQKYFGDEWYKIKPFNWDEEFRTIMKEEGGFDVVIGNPPYGMVTDENEKMYFEEKYDSTEGRFDKYELFIERGVKLCAKNGLVSYIVPSPLLSNLYTRRVRKFLLEKTAINEITNFGMNVFADPTIHICIIVLSNRQDKLNKVLIRKVGKKYC